MSALKQEHNVSVSQACSALGISRASLYRQGKTCSKTPKSLTKRSSSRALSETEKNEVVSILHSDEFADQPPREIYGTLLSRGIHVCSVRSMYRILGSLGENKERRNQRVHQKHSAPSLSATAPNQVWTWDITKLRGPSKGVFYYAYVVIDLYSRYVVGWLVERTENGALSEQLFSDACERHHIAHHTLTAHSDRGSPMTNAAVLDLFEVLGVSRSLGRPRVSNDNPFSESQFKTLKYQPDYPDRFSSLEHARAWLQEFISWYNDVHCHVGLGLFTPEDVFLSRVADVALTRQKALDERYAKNPERFVRGRPQVTLPPSVVRIDPDQLHRSQTIRCTEPPPEASVCLSPTQVSGDSAEGVSRAA